MAKQFVLFRFSLLLRQQRGLLEEVSDPSREEYLRDVLGSQIEFIHRKNTFIYVPDGGSPNIKELLGRIGRKVRSTENLPPENGLEESIHEGWRASVMVIDPTEHKDGQKVALEINKRVGSTNGLISSLVAKINSIHPNSAYELFAEPIFDVQTFWKFADENRGHITSLTFEFVVPNMFGVNDDIDDELVGYREHEKAQIVAVKIANESGLETDTQRIKESVNYVGRGTGKITARAGKYTYKSTDKFKTIFVDDMNGSEPLLIRIAKKVQEILDR
jgi:hypothetical protein